MTRTISLRSILYGVRVLAVAALLAVTVFTTAALAAGEGGRESTGGARQALTKPEVEAMLRAVKNAAAKAKQGRDLAEQHALEAEELAKEGSAFAAAEAAREADAAAKAAEKASAEAIKIRDAIDGQPNRFEAEEQIHATVAESVGSSTEAAVFASEASAAAAAAVK
ncbi:MAG TPA: hypothetical protein VED46_11140 [Alphaproteobacteria bacterium]|nr:hypothetical protein [Alphaproteobacteria bacterium]